MTAENQTNMITSMYMSRKIVWDNLIEMENQYIFQNGHSSEKVMQVSPRRISIYQFDIGRSLEDMYPFIPIFLTLNS